MAARKGHSACSIVCYSHWHRSIEPTSILYTRTPFLLDIQTLEYEFSIEAQISDQVVTTEVTKQVYTKVYYTLKEHQNISAIENTDLFKFVCIV